MIFRIIFVKFFLIVVIFSIIGISIFSQDAFSQYTDTPQSLTVNLKSSPYFYQDSEGYAVVNGIIENKNELSSISNVRIHVSFYHDSLQEPLEVNMGNTVIDVIPPSSEAPFSIRSKNPIPFVDDVSVNILGFDSVQNKMNGLSVSSEYASIDSPFRFSGSLQNTGAFSNNTKIHVAFYDGFKPPRILQVFTIDVGAVESDIKTPIEFMHEFDFTPSGAYLYAESDIFSSDVVEVKIPKRFASPLYQIKYHDIALDNIKCNDSKELIFKQTLKLAACVYPNSLEKLVERGWVMPIINS